MQKSYLVLENGRVFEGKALGHLGETSGEVVFTTGMAGYDDTLTDPCFYGQIIVQTFPLMGNYGIVFDENDNQKSYVKGYVARSICDEPSNFRCKGTLEDYLKEQKIVGICGIDTRELTKVIRECGTMNGKIVSSIDNLDDIINELKSHKCSDGVKNTSTKNIYVSDTLIKNDFKQKYNAVLYDLGSKGNIEEQFVLRDCLVTVVPYNTTSEKVLSYNPDFVILSDGAGSAADILETVSSVTDLLNKNIPVFGVSLGHQVLAKAKGLNVEKLKFGHRGANLPVKYYNSDRVYITNQNHGYCVDKSSLTKSCKLTFTNVNDGSVEGISYDDKSMSVQFMPICDKGPHDTSFIYDEFITLVGEGK